VSEVKSPEYNGPERRKVVVYEQCMYHREHKSKLEDHDRRLGGLETEGKEDRGDMWEDIKQKVPLKLFYMALIILTGALGYLVVTNSVMGRSITKIETVQQTMQQTDTRLELGLKDLSNKLETHREEWRKKNGDQ